MASRYPNTNLNPPGPSRYPPATSKDSNMPPHAPPAPHDHQTEELIERMRKHLPSTFLLRPLLTERLPGGATRFHIYKYPGESLANLNEFRKSGTLCDVTLHLRDTALPAHRVVLAACSNYFRAMFTRGMRETSCVDVHIRGGDVTPETLRLLVDFAYTSEVTVTRQNVQDLLVAAMFLEVSHVVEAATMFMEAELDPSNCIGFASFASRFGCLDMEAKAKKFIHENFCEVIKYDEFLTLDAEDMIQIAQRDELNVRCESQVFRAVVRWMEHNSRVPVCQLGQLLEKVRLTNLAPCFLETQLEKCPILKQIPDCERVMLTKIRKLYAHNAAVEAPRRCGKPEVVYCAGGFYRKPMDSLSGFECYNPCSREWTRLADLPRPVCGAGVTSLAGLVYVAGGRVMRCGTSHDACQLTAYDPATNRWETRANMAVARHRVGVAVLDGRLYAVGGSQMGEHHRSAERYDPDTDSWEGVAPMSRVRMSGGVAVVNRMLYVVGGYDGVRSRLASVECFHPEDNEWSEVESLNEPRSGAGVATLGGCIYVVGGFNGSQQLKSVERYNPQGGGWEVVAPLHTARSGLGVAVIGNKLLALGGYDGSDFLQTVESYDPEVNQWTSETDMLCARSGHGVAVDRQPDVS